jgi:hypothetical protein
MNEVTLSARSPAIAGTFSRTYYRFNTILTSVDVDSIVKRVLFD